MIKGVSRFFLFFAVFAGCVTVCFGADAPAGKQKILMVLTGVGQIPGSDRETGFWAEEYLTPCEIFRNAGYEVVTATLKGGKAPVDPGSLDAKTVGEAQAKKLQAQLAKVQDFTKTVPLKDVGIATIQAVFVVGGHGVMWDLTGSSEMQELVQKMVASDKIVAAVCHGPGALLKIKLPNGNLFLAGKTVTGFSAQEEEMAGMTRIVPYSLEAELQKESSGKYQKGDKPWEPFILTDGKLITGQNPASSESTAQALVKELKKSGK